MDSPADPLPGRPLPGVLLPKFMPAEEADPDRWSRIRPCRCTYKHEREKETLVFLQGNRMIKVAIEVFYAAKYLLAGQASAIVG
jgi:hypothetical protein